MSARCVLIDDMLDSTVLRSGLMDGFCVVLFEVGVVSSVGEFGSLPTLGENLEGISFSGECFDNVILLCRPSGL